jgi:hypothetical protein
MPSEGGREVAWSRVVGRWPHTAGMGTWGPGIFSNDTACDVRVAYRMALEDGLDDQAAQYQVLDEFAEVLHDDTWNDGPLVWLALAKTQWQLGRLDDHVKPRRWPSSTRAATWPAGKAATCTVIAGLCLVGYASNSPPRRRHASESAHPAASILRPSAAGCPTRKAASFSSPCAMVAAPTGWSAGWILAAA